ncbi:hypothetical protein QA802_28320 [Streptomyces sp. B21-105]|uniref:hypothetical protein n=1 Tax=Streptomyces sp. B21-105 TaxID=3039417 RepID=UPI002FEE80D4
MRRTSASTGTVARSPRRTRRALASATLASAALAALALTACGTEKRGADGPGSGHADTAGSSPARPGVAFAEMTRV